MEIWNVNPECKVYSPYFRITEISNGEKQGPLQNKGIQNKEPPLLVKFSAAGSNLLDLSK